MNCKLELEASKFLITILNHICDTDNNRWHRRWKTHHHSSGRVKEKQSTKKTVNRELQCFKRAGRPTDSCERYNGRTTGRKNGGREGKEGGRRPSKADEASQRFWEQGQGKPSTSSRGFIFFPLLSHPERVHLSGFTTTEGRPSPRLPGHAQFITARFQKADGKYPQNKKSL